MSKKKSQLEFGASIELEHSGTFDWVKSSCAKGHCPSNKSIAKHIALEHLAEDRNYYKKVR